MPSSLAKYTASPTITMFFEMLVFAWACQVRTGWPIGPARAKPLRDASPWNPGQSLPAPVAGEDVAAAGEPPAVVGDEDVVVAGEPHAAAPTRATSANAVSRRHAAPRRL